SCGGGGANLFANGGFEDGRDPWFSLMTEAWGEPFVVSDRQAHSGEQSALLELRSEDGGPARVHGVVAEVEPEDFPEVLSARYFVERWEQGTPLQYLQIVVIAWNARNIPAEVAQQQVPNHQVRYILAGVDRQPTFISNARYVMLSDGPPATGEWVRFERNVREDFQALWGAVPEDFENLRILFEVRWDERQPADGPSAADVYYDDLYLGPAPAPEA
ncbi:MAG: hypothetical protein U1B78_07115, partial [Dehalococcoidia bacterium]|nr:hypothetical protein [Dehalococcoidia bacterium]